jgi:hypothetical protein
LQSENRENNELFSVAEIEKEIAISKEPAVSILNSLLAGMYWSYYQNHRWVLLIEVKQRISKRRHRHLVH